MHKQEAAQLFTIIGDEDRIKILKLLYQAKKLDRDQLNQLIGCGELHLCEHLEILKDHALIAETDEGSCTCNRALLEELMHYIFAPCGCGKTENN